MLNIKIPIPELKGLPIEKRGLVLKTCLENRELSRKFRRVRIICFVVYSVLLMVHLILVPQPKTRTLAVIFTTLDMVGLVVAVVVAPGYLCWKMLRQEVKEKLRDL